MVVSDTTYEVRLRNGRVYVIDQPSGLIGEGASFDEALDELQGRREDVDALQRRAGVALPDGEFSMKPRPSRYVGKWIVAFVFVALMSVPLSYSISLGIKNGVKGIDYPRGGDIWRGIGDAIIDAANSDTLKDQPRQEEVVSAMRHILGQIRPYFEVFSEVGICGGAEPSSGP